MALAIVSFLELTAIFLNITTDTNLRFFLFFGSISCYNFLKYGIEVHKYSVKGSSQRSAIGVISILSVLIAFYYALKLNIQAMTIIVVLIALVLLYAFPIYPRQKNIRSLGTLKIILVALVWSGATVLLPVVSNLNEMNWDAYVVLSQRFITVIALMIPFEIRDMQFDPPNIRTLPRRIGIRSTKKLGVLIVFITYMMMYLRDEVNYGEIIGRAVFAVVLSLLILMTPEKPKKFYASFWVEALPVFWLISMYFTNLSS